MCSDRLPLESDKAGLPGLMHIAHKLNKQAGQATEVISGAIERERVALTYEAVAEQTN